MIEAHLAAFTSSWAAHGTPLAAEAAVLLDQIVVLAVDEALQMATGCSIDASVAARNVAKRNAITALRFRGPASPGPTSMLEQNPSNAAQSLAAPLTKNEFKGIVMAYAMLLIP